MKKIIIALTFLTFSCYLSKSFASTTIDEQSNNLPITEIILKTDWVASPAEKYQVKKDKLVRAELPDGVVCYIYPKGDEVLDMRAGDIIPILSFNRVRNSAVMNTENFDLSCTLSIVFYNQPASIKQIRKELSRFMELQ